MDEIKFGYLVDNVWHCGCGSLNAATREKCDCGKTQEEFKAEYKKKYGIN